MSLYKQFKTNENVETQGIILQYGFLNGPDGKPDESKPINIRIARAGGANEQFRKRFEAEVKPYRRQIQTETIQDETLKRIIHKVYAETVVLGWENVQDRDGNTIPFSAENCMKLFSDLPDWFADIQEQAQRASLFRAEIAEAEAKN